MYERKHHALLPMSRFAVRMLLHVAVALGLIGGSLLIGIAGYRYYEQMPWVDALLNAAMLLGGMGPVETAGLSAAGKVFASVYALYSGLLFIAVVGIILAPVVHRILHHFHWPGDDGGD